MKTSVRKGIIVGSAAIFAYILIIVGFKFAVNNLFKYFDEIDCTEIADGYCIYQRPDDYAALTIITEPKGNQFDEILDSVVSYRVVGKYILACQKSSWMSHKELTEIYKHGYKIPYYWIIDTRSSEKLGPYDYAEFTNECNRLGIEIF